MISDETLLRFSGEHLAYEMEMFFATAAELLRPLNVNSDLIKNALLEAFTIHARSILFFFYPENPRKDDALAEHFLTSKKAWNVIRPQLSPELKRLQKRVGKEIAHLSYTRLEIHPKNKGWDFGQIILEFISVFKLFTKNSASNKLHDHFLSVGNFWINFFIQENIFKAVYE